MIASSHLTFGAAIAVLSFNLLSRLHWFFGLSGALVIGVLSHFLLDAIPHDERLFYGNKSDSGFLLVFSVEILFTLSILYYLCLSRTFSNFSDLYILALLVGASLPDLPAVLNSFLRIDWRWLSSLDSMNKFFHSHYIVGLWPGLFIQLFISILSILAILYFKKLL